MRAPDEAPESPDPADEFLRLACLHYGNDSPTRWAEARATLAANPDLPSASVHVAAACADVEAVRSHLDADPSSAAAEGGPHRWAPLLYMAYARHDPYVDERRALETARLLLDHGADPNDGYLWHGLPTPFTVLTGVFGNGELGEVNQPAHPHAVPLGRVLLDAGADPNDGQLLYNRQFRGDDTHLVLLFEYGLGRGDGGVWRARLGDAADPPHELVQRQLRWAILHDMRDRVRLLVANGADLSAPFVGRWATGAEGRKPADVAATAGYPGMVRFLVELGASAPDLDGPDALTAAALIADIEAVERLGEFAGAARARRPSLIVWAAQKGNAAAVDALIDLGFDINALGRSDLPLDDPWQTALHVAAGDGDVALVRHLLARGADPSIRDARFNSTPLDWARHSGQNAAAAVLFGPDTP